MMITGWYPDVAVALWRRLLGVLGDVNKIQDGAIHELVFEYLLELWSTLFRVRCYVYLIDFFDTN